MVPIEISSNGAKLLQRSRWTLLFRGIILLLIGAVMFGNPESFFRALTIIIGIVLVVDGVVILSAARRNPGILILGVIIVVLGLFALCNPQGTNMLIACATGLWIFISAVQDIYFGLTVRKSANFLWMIPAILMLVIGATIFCAPWIGIEIAGIWMGMLLLFSGAFTIAAAISIWNFKPLE